MVDQAGGRPTVLELGNGGVPISSSTDSGSSTAGGGERGIGLQFAGRLQSPWSLRNWRMRWRLLALVIIPTVAAIGLGAVRVQSARDSAASFARVGQLAALGNQATVLADDIEDEANDTAGYIAAGKPASGLKALKQQYLVTDGGVAAVQQQAKQVGPAFPSVARTDLTFALSRVSALPDLRDLAASAIAPLPLITDYSSVVSTLLSFDNELGAGSSSTELGQSVSALESLAQAEDEASQQRAILYQALLQGQFGLGDVNALVAAQSGEASALAAYQTAAGKLSAYLPGSGFSDSLTQSAQFNNMVAGTGVDNAQSIEQDALIQGNNGQPPSGDAGTWNSGMRATLQDIREVESDDLASITAQASLLHQDAEGSEQLTTIIVLVLLLLVLLVTIIMARSMIAPLRTLRADALDVAGRRLPDMVRRLSESEAEGGEDGIQIEPIGIDSTDEIGEVARAFDQVHREAVRLAADEALLRANLNAMFVNLSRRSQSLIERQLGIIESLEQSEQEPDRLSNLFRLDHLATRMRRNSENLLVLAGHEAPRKWGRPVSLVDVLRAAISEIEHYERINLNVQPGVVVSGRTASDVVHLAAELVENATTFSPEETPVLVTAQRVSSGGVLIEIVDNGLGIAEQELAYANWRLDHPPVVDVAVSRRMGLFVVGRLASRHGIRVKLRRPQKGRGLCALIWLPDTVAEHDSVPVPGMPRRRLDADLSGDTGRYAAAVTAQSIPTVRRSVARTQAAESGWTALPAQPAASYPSGPQPIMATRRQAAWSGDGPDVVIMPPAAQEAADGDGYSGTDSDGHPAAGGQERRLPIYESVESDWFRRGGTRITDGGKSAAGSWLSPADDGFRAAQAAASPAAGETTMAGLPKRVPSANLVPGSVGSRQAEQPESRKPASRKPAVGASARSAEQTKSWLTNFQRGARAGRAAASGSYETDDN